MSLDQEPRRDDLEATEQITTEETAAAETQAETAAEQAVEETTEAPAAEAAEEAETAESAEAEGDWYCLDYGAEPLEMPAAPQKKKSVGGWIALAVVLVAAAIAAVLYFTWKNRDVPPAGEGMSDAAEETNAPLVAGVGSVSIDAADVTEEISTAIVAENKKQPDWNFAGWLQSVFSDNKTPENAVLSNGRLAVYYGNSFYQFSNQYYYYLDALGMDPMHLDETDAGEGQTWQEFFLSAALDSYHTQNAVYQAALDEGMELPEEYQADFDAMVEDLSTMEDINDQLLAVYGPSVTLEDYMAFMRENYYYTAYLERVEAGVEYSEEDLQAFYDAHAEQYEGLEQTEDRAVDVRHILITPDDREDEASWAAAEAHANELYEQWKADGATEEGFAALAGQESEDPGSVSNGGLYEGVLPGQMVEQYNDWCFAPSRQVGDSGLVRTDYGFHIMYLSGVGEMPYWMSVVASDYTLEKAHETASQIADRYTLSFDIDSIKIALAGQIIEMSEAGELDG